MSKHFSSARSRAAQHQRHLNADIEEMYIATYRLAFSKLKEAYRKITSYLAAGGALSNDRLFDMGFAETKKCPFCDCTIQTMDHTLSFCQHPELVKARAWVDGDPLNIDSIPQSVLPSGLG